MLITEWQSKKIQDVCSIIKGRKPNTFTLLKTPTSCPYLLIESFDGSYKKFTEDTSLPDCLPGDIVIVMDGARSGLVASGLKGKLGSTLASLRINDKKVNSKYLFYFLKANYEMLNTQTKGATIPHIDKHLLKNLSLPVPPIEKQIEIATNIEKVEQLREWRDQSDGLTRSLIYSVFFKTFGDPFSSNQFRLKKISEITTLVSYGFTRPMPHKKEGIPIITSKNVAAGKIDFVNVDYTDEKSFSVLSKKDCPENGDILYTKDGRIGEAALVTRHERFCISQAVAILKPNKKLVNPRFLEKLLNIPEFREVVKRMAYGVALKHVSISKLKQLEVICPPLDLQEKFVEIANKLEQITEMQVQSRKSIENLENNIAMIYLEEKKNVRE